jgi:hypothetical protein
MKATRQQMQRWLVYKGGMDGTAVLSLTNKELEKKFKETKGKKKLNLKSL